MPARTLLVVLVYIASILLWRPQNRRGWPFEWFLYSKFVDLVLGVHFSLTPSTCAVLWLRKSTIS